MRSRLAAAVPRFRREDVRNAPRAYDGRAFHGRACGTCVFKLSQIRERRHRFRHVQGGARRARLPSACGGERVQSAFRQRACGGQGEVFRGGGKGAVFSSAFQTCAGRGDGTAFGTRRRRYGSAHVGRARGKACGTYGRGESALLRRGRSHSRVFLRGYAPGLFRRTLRQGRGGLSQPPDGKRGVSGVPQSVGRG